ncbi:MAG: glycerophosphoryl diester phosphodiesterase [Candidatus Micrarchaeota archaeon]|nr:MAG: glycerophosphoryl diester phosphodiesterase [Candidatus Micrarchaeota archaeon]
MKEFLIVAHRGASAYAKENTLEAYRLAIEQHANAIEIDVRLTKDNKAICFHDETLRSFGINMKPEEIMLDSIKDLIENDEIALLDDALDLIRDKTYVLFDVRDDKVAGYILDSISKNELKRVYIISGRDYILKEVRELDDKVKLGFWYFRYSNLINLIEELNIELIKPNYRVCHKNDIERFHKLNRKVLTWVINNKEDMQRFIEYGIDGIVTDDPKLLYNTLRQTLL